MLEQLQTIIDQQIAPAHHMGLVISEYQNGTLTVSAPLEKNANHHGTAFGGSQYSMAAVAGWALLRCKLTEANLIGTIVVKTASMDYRRPVSSETFSVKVMLAEPELLSIGLKAFTETGGADFSIVGTLRQNDKDAAVFRATYSVKKPVK